ncbi:MAG: ABC transporter substrate-binding protein [Nitrospirales bacterium]|nr:hypothetical protein [Nitrospira sp.]MDR4503060.1 ABC transporter substrate-binding protein [Nitrospirales bacterium]
MAIKRLLIFIPCVITVFLLQSYFWVPTYEKQASGNPGRLETYIEGSIGDAKILNPILNADMASATIVGHLFEGLLDLDEDLSLRGRLATRWEITEHAYLLVDPQRRFPDGTRMTGSELLRRIRADLTKEPLSDTLPEMRARIQSIRLLPPEKRREKVSVFAKDERGVPRSHDVSITITVPERIEFVLDSVDQDLFDRLIPVIGEGYLEQFPHADYIVLPPELSANLREKVQMKFPRILPVGEHNPQIVFHLRPGVKFHDGHEFDAKDVKFTYEAIMDPKNLSPRTSDFEPIKRIDIIDPLTVKVIYKRLFSPAINAWTMGMLPEHLLNQKRMQEEMTARGLSEEARESFGMRDSHFNLHPVGSGRFRFVEWHSDEYIHLTRFDDYWEGPAEYHDYYMRIIPDLFTQELEFQAGAVDYYGAQPHQVSRYKQDETYQHFSSLAFAYNYIGYNIRKPLFSDPDVRRALSMAINVDEMLKYLVYGEGEQITGPYPKNTEWYNPDVPPIPYDPDGARKLLKARGWKLNQDGVLEKDGQLFKFTLITNHGNPIRKNILSIAQNSWKKIGVKCKTQVFEWAVFLKDFVNTAEFDAVVLGWSMNADPDLYQLWHSSQVGPQQLNFVGYQNPLADELIVRIRQEYDKETQRILAHELHRVIYEDQPYTFLYAPLSTRVLDKKIVLVYREKDGKEYYRKIYPTKTGNEMFHFHRWRKLEFLPNLLM